MALDQLNNFHFSQIVCELVLFRKKFLSANQKCDPVGRITMMYFNILGGVGSAGTSGCSLHQHSLYAKALEYSVGTVAET